MTDAFLDWLRSDWMTALGWTFVHSLWQIALIGAALYLCLRSLPARRAAARYACSTMALWLVVVSAIGTYIIMLPEGTGPVDIAGPVYLQAVADTPDTLHRIRTWLEDRMPVMLVIWLAGASVLLARLLISLGWLWQIRRTAMPVDMIQDRLDHLVKRFNISRRPSVASSGWMPSPVTIGHLKPIILFPVAIVNRLQPHEVEAILAHELAHIVRRDYLANLVQSFIEAVFYYHPVVWWMSGVVRAERENRADDLAVRWHGDAVGYARTLIAVQEWQQEAHPAMAIGFASKGKQTLFRIQRILNLPYKHHHHMEKSVLLSLTSLVIMAFALQGHTPNPASASERAGSNALAPFVEMAADTIPAKGTYRIHKKTDDQEVRLEIENGDIRELEVDGKKIEPSAFGEYEDLIDDLVGGLQAPPAPSAPFFFNMPAIPHIPSIPDIPQLPPDFLDGFNFSFEMPDIPEMPEIPPFPDIHINRIFPGSGSRIFLWDGSANNEYQILTDSVGETSRMIIVTGDDTTVVMSPSISLYGDMIEFHSGDREEDMKAWQEKVEAMQREAESRARAWEGEITLRSRELAREAERHSRDMEREIRRQYDLGQHPQGGVRPGSEPEYRVYGFGKPLDVPGFRSPQSALTNQLIRDKLIDPDQEAEVLLTPDKLRIDGKKMPDNLHKKYLDLYEAQQGDPLTGNSRVEFTTKARRQF
jgi:beta-lactamase regulating signal transducer with metallopeptidase domain